MSPFLLSCSILIVNRGIVSQRLNVNPILFVLVNFLGDYRFTMLELLSLTMWISIQIPIIHDNISSQVADKRRHGLGQWRNSSIIHDIICSISHKKCLPRSYHSDIEYHMTLNMIFSVVGTLYSFYTVFPLYLDRFVFIHTSI